MGYKKISQYFYNISNIGPALGLGHLDYDVESKKSPQKGEYIIFSFFYKKRWAVPFFSLLLRRFEKIRGVLSFLVQVAKRLAITFYHHVMAIAFVQYTLDF